MEASPKVRHVRKVHKVVLRPSALDRQFLDLCSLQYRRAYNWAIETWRAEVEACKLHRATCSQRAAVLAGGPRPKAADRCSECWPRASTSFYGLCELWKSVKLDVAFDRLPKVVAYQALRDAGTAIRAYETARLRGVKNAADMRPPKFLSLRKRLSWGCQVQGPNAVHGNRLRPPGRFGHRAGGIKMTEAFRWPGAEVKHLSFVLDARNRWVVSIGADVPVVAAPPVEGKVSGVDLGFASLAVQAVLEPGAEERYVEHRASHRGRGRKRVAFLERKIGRLDKRIARSRNVHGKNRTSRRRQRLYGQRRRCYLELRERRAAALHLATSSMVREAEGGRLTVENLSLKGMSSGRYGKSVHRGALAECKRQVAYKSDWAGVEVVEADRFFASTRTCPACLGRTGPATVEERKWTCSGCGESWDRDRAAALNLALYEDGGGEGASADGGSAGPVTGGGRIASVNAAGVPPEVVNGRGAAVSPQGRESGSGGGGVEAPTVGQRQGAARSKPSGQVTARPNNGAGSGAKSSKLANGGEEIARADGFLRLGGAKSSKLANGGEDSYAVQLSQGVDGAKSSKLANGGETLSVRFEQQDGAGAKSSKLANGGEDVEPVVHAGAEDGAKSSKLANGGERTSAAHCRADQGGAKSSKLANGGESYPLCGRTSVLFAPKSSKLANGGEATAWLRPRLPSWRTAVRIRGTDHADVHSRGAGPRSWRTSVSPSGRAGVRQCKSERRGRTVRGAKRAWSCGKSNGARKRSGWRRRRSAYRWPAARGPSPPSWRTAVRPPAIPPFALEAGGRRRVV